MLEGRAHENARCAAGARAAAVCCRRHARATLEAGNRDKRQPQRPWTLANDDPGIEHNVPAAHAVGVIQRVRAADGAGWRLAVRERQRRLGEGELGSVTSAHNGRERAGLPLPRRLWEPPETQDPGDIADE
jgi:hypothetical protein